MLVLLCFNYNLPGDMKVVSVSHHRLSVWSFYVLTVSILVFHHLSLSGFVSLFFNACVCFSVSLSIFIFHRLYLPSAHLLFLVCSALYSQCFYFRVSPSPSILSLSGSAVSGCLPLQRSPSLSVSLAPCFLQGTAGCISQYLPKPHPSFIPATQVRGTFLHSVLQTQLNNSTDYSFHF